MTSSPEPAAIMQPEPMELADLEQQPRVRRLSVEPVVRQPRRSQTTMLQTEQANYQPRPMKAQDFHSADRDPKEDQPWPSQSRAEPEFMGPTEPQPQAVPQAAKQPRPKLNPKYLTPDQELARQAGILGAMEAASAILAARLLLFVTIAIAAVLAFNVNDVFSAGVFGAWVGFVTPIVALIDWSARRRPS